ncbi:hypothetical protein ABK040_002504 [Willaertia magna]
MEPQQQQINNTINNQYVLFSGYLSKRGNFNKNWKKRYFELNIKNFTLNYYKESYNQNNHQNSIIINNNNNTQNSNFNEQKKKKPLGSIHLDSTQTKLEICHQELKQILISIPGTNFKKYYETIFEPKNINSENENINLNQIIYLYKNRFKRTNSLQKRSKSIFNNFTTTIENNTTELLSPIIENKLGNKITNLFKTKKFKFAITINVNNENKRKYKFFCDTEEERDQWIEMITIVMEEHYKTLQKNNQINKFIEKLNLFNPKQFITILNTCRSSVNENVVISLMILLDFHTLQKSCISFVKSSIEIEFNFTKDHPETLFRRNSWSTKLIQLFFKIHGQPFIVNTLQSIILEICKRNEFIEIDENKIKENILQEFLDFKNIEGFEQPSDEIITKIVMERQNSHKIKLINITKLILKNIIENTIKYLPIEICEILEFTMELLSSDKYNKYFLNKELTLGSLFFLRFICPAIISPHLYNIIEEQPLQNSQRTLTLIVKIIQNIANQIDFTKIINEKESYMNILKDFINLNINECKVFLFNISNLNQFVKEEISKKKLSLNFFIENNLIENCLNIIKKYFIKIEENNKFITNEKYLIDLYNEILISLDIPIKNYNLFMKDNLDSNYKVMQEQYNKIVNNDLLLSNYNNNSSVVVDASIVNNNNNEQQQQNKVLVSPRRKRGTTIRPMHYNNNNNNLNL